LAKGFANNDFIFILEVPYFIKIGWCNLCNNRHSQIKKPTPIKEWVFINLMMSQFGDLIIVLTHYQITKSSPLSGD